MADIGWFIEIFAEKEERRNARIKTDEYEIPGGHRTRVAAVTLDNMAERVFAQREDLP